MNSAKTLSRREAIRTLGAGTLLTLGLWPGALRAADTGNAGSFRFLAVNDTHCLSPECEEYLAGLVRQMKTEEAEFCLHVGDLTEKGERQWMEAVKRVFGNLGAPMYPVIGNHDYLTQADRSGYTGVFPDRLNYTFEHRGWQFVGLDTTQGLLFDKTTVQPETLRWLDDTLPRLDRRKPTVLFTHFPLGSSKGNPSPATGSTLARTIQEFSMAIGTVKYRPQNADDLLDRFREFNLRAVFGGHYHAFTECRRGEIVLTTDRCCSLKRDNHDGSKEKGYFVCDAKDGLITRRFVEYKAASGKPPAAGKS